jgi:cytochrome b pre-mRNA-processing protein 3
VSISILNIVSFFSSIFGSGDKLSEKLLFWVVAQTRIPNHYEDQGVPDTFDGRFDLLCLHSHLLVRRLVASGDVEMKGISKRFTQRLVIEFDRSCRDIGVSDVSVGKHVKRMTESYYGRAVAYEEALISSDDELLTEALTRNLYATLQEGPDENKLSAMSSYIRKLIQELDNEYEVNFRNGQLPFMSAGLPLEGVN